MAFTPPLDRTQLLRLLATRFNDSELRTLCFHLSISYEDLAGQAKSDKARELVLYCERHERMADLIAACQTPPQTQSEPIVSVAPVQHVSVNGSHNHVVTSGRDINGGGQSSGAHSSRPATRDQANIVVKLQLVRLVGQDFEVRALDTPMGQPMAIGRLPYNPTELTAVLKLIERGFTPDAFSAEQTATLQRLGLMRGISSAGDALKVIGQGLFRALFPDKVGEAMRMALNQGRSEGKSVMLQLRFDHDAVALARYPWELLHDDNRFMISAGTVALARYISYPESNRTLPVRSLWNLLYIAPRPQDQPALPQDVERLAVWDSLRGLTDAAKLIPELLAPATYNQLLDATASVRYHILHFDGHGTFARRCNVCGTLHHPHITSCQSCHAPMTDVEPIGFLAFDTGRGTTDYVSTDDLEHVLADNRSAVRLVFLSACQSATVRGASLFGGLGPSLIRAGVPAVVAMQFQMPAGDARIFAEGFYKALAGGETLPNAVAQGRRALFRSKTWFYPTLYLRSSDDEGALFV